MRRLIPLIFLSLFLLPRDYDPALAKKVEDRLLRIERESKRFLRWLYSKKEDFSQQEVNSYINYALEKRQGDVIFRGVRVVLQEGAVILSGGLILKKPIPGFEIGARGWKIIPIRMKFSIVQAGDKYRTKLQESFLGRTKINPKLFSTLLPVLKDATGFNFDQERWKPLPFGLKRVEVHRGKVTVYY